MEEACEASWVVRSPQSPQVWSYPLQVKADEPDTPHHGTPWLKGRHYAAGRGESLIDCRFQVLRLAFAKVSRELLRKRQAVGRVPAMREDPWRSEPRSQMGPASIRLCFEIRILTLTLNITQIGLACASKSWRCCSPTTLRGGGRRGSPQSRQTALRLLSDARARCR